MKRAAIIFAALVALCAPALAGNIVAGDSIAVGAGAALHWPTLAKVGASSCDILFTIPQTHYDTAVISAGTNDVPGRCVAAIRERIHADKVVFILPVNGARGTVAAVARAHGDATVSYAPGPDHIHPRSYGALAASIRAVL